MELYRCEASGNAFCRILFISGKSVPDAAGLSEREQQYVTGRFEKDHRVVEVNRFEQIIWLISRDPDSQGHSLLENLRRDGCELVSQLNKQKVEEAILEDYTGESAWMEALVEGMMLGSYQFLSYLSRADEKRNSFSRLGLTPTVTLDPEELSSAFEAVKRARDLVNEPLSHLNAPQLAEKIRDWGQEAGFQTEILDKKRIESLQMGGLLAVNKGSIDPPRFVILTWEPTNAVNDKPLVLVGKGVMYDTGGLSLKPTLNSMDYMKSDMAGAAAVAASLYAVARLNWPVKVIGLIPATDNRPDGNAYAPGDVIRMHDGSTVEVLNTDAEGRMLLADALTYAKKYDPELVIDLATLTGTSQLCLGAEASALMGTAADSVMNELVESGFASHERLVRFPLWPEYDKMLESDIADRKNIGGRLAGGITAGKFLQHFTDYPWMHLDIAGTAFLSKRDAYRGPGGTGVGVRLLIHFIRSHFLKTN